ncbi:MAG: hypothetical protein U0163_06920 [Gemmatimonadaceae bacterium]
MIIAARVLDLPDPVTPVTSMPRSAVAIRSMAAGKAQLRCRRHRRRNHAHHDETRPLPQDVHAKATDAGRAPRAIVVQQRVDLGLHLLIGDQAQGNRARLVWRQRLLGHRHELAIDPRPKHVARLDVQV